MQSPAHDQPEPFITTEPKKGRAERIQAWVDSRKPKAGHQLMTIPGNTDHYIDWEDDLQIEGPEIYH